MSRVLGFGFGMFQGWGLRAQVFGLGRCVWLKAYQRSAFPSVGASGPIFWSQPKENIRTPPAWVGLVRACTLMLGLPQASMERQQLQREQLSGAGQYVWVPC